MRCGTTSRSTQRHETGVLSLCRRAMRKLLACVAVVITACGPMTRTVVYVGREESAVTARVDHDLVRLRSARSPRCGTPRVMIMSDLRSLGQAAVPALIRALDSGVRSDAVAAASLLVGFGHDRVVSAWCDVERVHPYRDAMCRHSVATPSLLDPSPW